MFKLDLEKAEEPEIRLPTSVGSSKKQESSRKTSISVLLTMPKPLTVWITTNCGKFLKRWEQQTPCLHPEKSVCRSRSNSQNRTWNKGLVPNWERSTSRLYTCHSAYLTYMQSTSCEMPGQKKHKQESRLLGEISITSDMQMTPPYGRKGRRTKEPLDESEKGE